MEVQNREMRFKNFTGFSGTGAVTGEGLLAYDFTQPLSVNVRFLFKDITLNIPKDFSTTGEGELNIKGNKLALFFDRKLYCQQRADNKRVFHSKEERGFIFEVFVFKG